MYKKYIKPVLSFIFMKIISPIIFILLRTFSTLGLTRYLNSLFLNDNSPNFKKTLWGINFNNPIGIQLDINNKKNTFNILSDIAFGFSFIDIGPLALEHHKASLELDPKVLIQNLKDCNLNVPIALSISISNNTCIDEKISHDYEKCFAMLYDFVDILNIDITCPIILNNPKLRSIESLSKILDDLLNLRRGYEKYKAILLKVNEAYSEKELEELIAYCRLSGIDGMVLESRDFKTCEKLLAFINKTTKARFPIITCGAIANDKDAKILLEKGASLVEIQDNLLFTRPQILKKSLKELSKN